MSRKRTENRRRKKPARSRRPARLLISGSVLVLAALLLIALSMGLSWAYGALLEADIFRLERIRINGIKRLDRNRVLDALGIPKGTNMLHLRMRQLEHRLSRLPWVRSASVRLDLPAQLTVTLQERQPVARLSGPSPCLLDSTGELFAPGAGEPMPTLPRLEGIEGRHLTPGQRLPEEVITEIHQLLAQLRSSQSGWKPEDLSAIVWTTGQGLGCKTLNGKFEVFFGRDRYRVKFERLQRILKLLARNGEIGAVQQIDLDYEHRAFLTWRGTHGSSL